MDPPIPGAMPQAGMGCAFSALWGTNSCLDRTIRETDPRPGWGGVPFLIAEEEERRTQVRRIAGEEELAVRGVYQQRTFARRMARSVEELQRTVPEQVEVVIEFKQVVATGRHEIIEDERKAPLGVGP